MRPIKYDYTDLTIQIVCAICKEDKNITEYRRGLYSKCKKCHSKNVMANRKRSKKSLENFRAYQNEYIKKKNPTIKSRSLIPERNNNIYADFLALHKPSIMFKQPIYKALADKYKVHRATISKIINTLIKNENQNSTIKTDG